jgi:hypothetical protein
MGSTFYTNQFGQQVAIGDLDLNIQEAGGLAGILSPNQSSPATTVSAGFPAKFDANITSGYVPNFLQAGENDFAIGFFRRTMQEGVFGLGDQVIVSLFGGPVIWLLANATITPGAVVYNDSTGAYVTVTSASSRARGIALDYAVSGQALRVLVLTPVAIQSLNV